MSPTIPTTVQEFEEALSDTGRIRAMFNDNTFGEFVAGYARVMNDEKFGDVSRQTSEEVQRGLADFARANGLTNGRSVGRSDRKRESDPLNPGTALNGEFSGLRDFLRSVVPANRQTSADRQRWDRITNDYSSLIPSQGGFLVPETVRTSLIMDSLENAVVRPLATVIEMDAPRVSMPAVDAATHSGSVHGGVSWTWVAEGESLPESDAKFARVLLDAAKLVTTCDAPTELVLDSPRAFGSFIDTAMPEAIAFGSDYAYLNGTGVGQPLGMLNAGNTGLVVVAKETNQPNDTVVKENIDKMFSRMLPSALGRAVWVATIDTFPQLVSMAATAGTGGSPVWLSNGSVAGAPPVSIYGRPVMWTEKTPKLGDQGDLSFVDPSKYFIGDRGEMRVQSSEHTKWGNDLISFRVIMRGDGRPAFKSAITPANGSTTTLSPYITLAAR